MILKMTKNTSNFIMHSVSFTQIHSGGDDDDACLMGGSILQN